MPSVIVSKNSCKIEALYQWDVGQVLSIYGLTLPTVSEVHFAHGTSGLAIVRTAEVGADGTITAAIPNSLLQKSQKINAYVCAYEGEEFRTIYKIEIPVIGRAKPSEYAGEDEAEVYSLEALGVEVTTLAPGQDARVEKVLQGDKWLLRFSIPRGANGLPGHTPQKGVDYWTADDLTAIVADVLADSDVKNASTYAAAAQQAAGDAATARTGAQTAQSDAEAAKTAAVAAAAAAEEAARNASAAAGGGVTSFNGRGGAVTPQKGDYSADDIAFEDGQTFQQKYDSGELKGKAGDNGATFTPNVDADGNLSWTNNGGLANPQTVNIKGGKGDPGKTPVKGTDYFTDADKTEMVADVVEEMGNVAPASHTHKETDVTIAAATDYTTVRVRGIALAQDNAISVPNGCLCGVYSTS